MAPVNYARHWCFTLNNPQQTEMDIVDALEPHVDYLIFQLEQGESGTPHYQGYFILSRKQRLTAIRRWIPGAHFEVAKGSPQANRDYCSKADGKIGETCEIGTIPGNAGQGARTDMQDLQSALQQGLTQDEYRDQFFSYFVRYPNLHSQYHLAGIKARSEDTSPSCVLLYGPPRTGKSRLAASLGRYLGGFYRHSLKQWFDGYRGEHGLIFDDFCGSSATFGDFKRIVDRYPLRVQVKGSSCELAATKFIITSNRDPRSWWKEEVVTGDFAAIFGRITKVLWFVGPNQYRLYHSGTHFETDFYDPLPFDGYPQAFRETETPPITQLAYPLELESLREMAEILFPQAPLEGNAAHQDDQMAHPQPNGGQIVL